LSCRIINYGNTHHCIWLFNSTEVFNTCQEAEWFDLAVRSHDIRRNGIKVIHHGEVVSFRLDELNIVEDKEIIVAVKREFNLYIGFSSQFRNEIAFYFRSYEVGFIGSEYIFCSNGNKITPGVSAINTIG